MRTIKVFYFGFLFFITTSYAQVDSVNTSERAPLYDTTKVALRHFNGHKLTELKSDTDLKYESGPPTISLWERFKIWLRSLINKLLQMLATTNWGNVLVGVATLVIIIYVVLRLLKVDALKIFYSKSDKGTIRLSVIEDDIHAMDFEKLLQEAMHKKEYRIAIRLLFLHALKILADQHHIQWQPGKTNHDYMNELQAVKLKTGFNELNFYFEYAWYGNFAIREELFNKVNNIFGDWRSHV